MRLLILLMVLATPLAAADEDVFGMPRPVVTLIGVGLALMLLAGLFLVRRFIGTVVNVLFLLLGAALVIVALFGHQIGIYDAIDDIVNAQPAGPGP